MEMEVCIPDLKVQIDLYSALDVDVTCNFVLSLKFPVHVAVHFLSIRTGHLLP